MGFDIMSLNAKQTKYLIYSVAPDQTKNFMADKKCNEGFEPASQKKIINPLGDNFFRSWLWLTVGKKSSELDMLWYFSYDEQQTISKFFAIVAKVLKLRPMYQAVENNPICES